MSKTLKSLNKHMAGYSCITVSSKQLVAVNQEVDAMNESMASEILKLREALKEIAGKEGEVPWSRAACEAIARDALKEGV